MTSLKDQQKLLKDAGKGVDKIAGKGVDKMFEGVSEGFKKVSEPFVKEAVFIPGAIEGAKKIVNTVKSTIKKGDK